MHSNLGCKGEVHGTWESAAKMKRRHWVSGRGSPSAKPWIGKAWEGKWVGEHPWREKGIKRYLSMTVFSTFNSSFSSLHNPMRKVLLPGPSRISWDQRTTFPGATWKWQAWWSWSQEHNELMGAEIKLASSLSRERNSKENREASWLGHLCGKWKRKAINVNWRPKQSLLNLHIIALIIITKFNKILDLINSYIHLAMLHFGNCRNQVNCSETE